MDKITKEYIEQQAPDLSTVKNAVSLSNKKSFILHSKTEDESLYFAECKGSGKNNYKVSADFSVENQPVFRCSCPSRKLPCKHSIGLLQEILNGATFNIAEVPEDIKSKREKAEKREAKKADDIANPKPKKVNKTAKLKKMKKQLEGLDIAEKLVSEILEKGVSTIDLQASSIYTDIAKEFGNYYLTGLQNYVYELINQIQRIKNQKNDKSIEVNYSPIINTLTKFNSLVKKSRVYLEDKVNTENVEDDDNELFEHLGGVWKLEDLNAIGLKKENPKLLQLGFYILDSYSEKRYTDVSYFCDLETGAVNPAFNYRPYKATKYINEVDIIFDVVCPDVLSYYPGTINQRIRFAEYKLEDVNKTHTDMVRSFAKDIDTCVKGAKNYLKNTLSRETFPVIISYDLLGVNANGNFVLRDKTEILVKCKKTSTYKNLSNLPNNDLYKNQVMFGEIYFDYTSKTLCVNPLSIISSDVIYI